MIKFVAKWMLMVLVIGMAIVLWHLPGMLDATERTVTPAVPSMPTLEQIRALSVLTTLRVEVADVCEVEVGGRTGGMKAVFVVRGSATLGVDLKNAKFTVTDAGRRHAVLELPQPTVQTVSLDHERTRIAAMQTSGLWIILPGNSDADAVVVEKCFRRGQQIVGEAARDGELADRARNQSVAAFMPYFAALNSTVEYRWASP